MDERFGWGSDEHIAALSEEVDSRCMLEDKHGGEHEWTKDDCIGVTFAPNDETSEISAGVKQ